MLYVAFKLTCNPLFFKQVAFNFPFLVNEIKLTGSSMIYPLTYIVCDLLSLRCNRRLLVVIILIGATCDGLFSFLTYVMAYFPHPATLSKNGLYANQALNFLGSRMWSLFYHGVIGSIVATVLEVSLFRFLYGKIKHVVISTFLSVSSLLVIHNLISNYPVMSSEPDGLSIVVNSTSAELCFLLIYIIIIGIFIKNKHFYNSIKYLSNTIITILPGRQTKNEQDVHRAVHDIRSPLTVIDNIVDNIPQNVINPSYISDLKNAINNVRYISHNLLNNEVDASQNQLDTSRCYCLPSGIIQNVITSKMLEWKDNPCEILYNPVNIEKSWLYLAPYDLQRMLSNLINNAYEARYTDSKILINAIDIETKIIISIVDYGIGIEESKINEVLNGTTFKPQGNGIGLSSAVQYVKSLDGALTITSNKIEGTIVTITLPVTETPKWLKNTIQVHKDQEIVICDNELSINTIWQDILIEKMIKFKHFLNSKDFVKYIKNKSNLLILMDFELNEKHNGLEILKRLGIKDAYLVTNYAEQSWLQKLVSETNYYLVPKCFLSPKILSHD